MLSHVHKTSSKFTWWVDQSGTWSTLRPVHTAVFSVRQWQLKCHGWWGNVFWNLLEIRVRFQGWCLLQVSSLSPDAEKCTNTHHARSKNSTSRLLQFMLDHWSAQSWKVPRKGQRIKQNLRMHPWNADNVQPSAYSLSALTVYTNRKQSYC